MLVLQNKICEATLGSGQVGVYPTKCFQTFSISKLGFFMAKICTESKFHSYRKNLVANVLLYSTKETGFLR